MIQELLIEYWALTYFKERDDKEAINEDNIIDSRTRGAKPEGGYTEPGDEEGLGGNDGRSAVAGGPN